jgi:hypothetical protein
MFDTFTFTEVCSESVCSLRRWSFKHFKEARIGEWLERIRYRRAFEDVLRQCQETMKRFEGSEETLRHIQRVEESLKRLVTETN